jgi:hypothetical protein
MSPIKLESYRDRPFNLQEGGLWFFIKKIDFQSYRKKYGWNIQQGTNFDALYMHITNNKLSSDLKWKEGTNNLI